MGQKSGPEKEPAEQVIKQIRRVTRRQFSAEEKIRIVLSGLRGEDSIAELCRREGIVQNAFIARRCCSAPPGYIDRRPPSVTSAHEPEHRPRDRQRRQSHHGCGSAPLAIAAGRPLPAARL